MYPVKSAIRRCHFQNVFSNPLQSRKVHLENTQDGIARISFREPGGKVSVLSLSVLEKFENLLTEVKDLGPRAVIIDIENLAGADLRMILEGLDDPVLLRKIVETGHRVFSQLQNLPFPSFAFIHKACLGGGSELVLGCTYRIVTDDPKTKLGFPETGLGLFPCWGAPGRFPRLVGGPQAINRIALAETVSGKQAREIQLADALYSREFLEDKGIEIVEFYLTPEGERLVRENRKNLQSPPWPGFSREECITPGLIAINLMYATNEMPLEDALKVEREVFLNMPPQAFEDAKHLISSFLNKKAPSTGKE